ncbi:GNAT family N-acetyltransferase [Nocardioides sp.]|uniref:GNAT family N-acetyltransferase n=1 Tax=Nocardioides sp. TaxID=35761 RepID=UPI00271B4B7E|nr:GNAT family N-acetyltransferase [Nocardioides sp.]MDO9456405.1 GNAT family N-acetyltransferase [Nocardioides sp.]
MPPEDETPVSVTDNPAEHRFEIRYGDRLAGFTVYQERHDGYAFVHTEIEPDLEGHGLASRLVRVAMDAMAERGTSVLPFCPYVTSWLAKHPDHLGLVPDDQREAFGLPAA